MSRRALPPVNVGSIVVAGSAVLVVVGAFLPWITVPGGDPLTSLHGTDLFLVESPLFNGLVTSTIAAIATPLALFLRTREWITVLTAALGLVIEVIGVVFVIAPDVALGETVPGGTAVSLASTGLGVYVTLVAGLGIILGSVINYWW